MNAIKIRNLKKVYANGTQALNGIDLDVKEGDFFALLGANGAGKTTIIGILTGLVNKTSGSVEVFDYNLDTHSNNAKALMGVVPQEINFNFFLKVMEIVVNAAGYFGFSRKDAMIEAEIVLKELELWDKRNVVAKNLSGGMKRRLMIARALVTKPKLLILDEPTAGVDVELRYTMWKYLIELNKRGTTILLTTHYLEEVEQLCKVAAIIRDGKIMKNDLVKNLVKMVEEQTYVVHVEEIRGLDQLSMYQAQKIDETTFELDLKQNEKLNDCITKISQTGMILTDLRPKGNRLEHLFLHILK